MLKFYNDLYDFLALDISINGRTIVSGLYPGAYSRGFNAIPGLYTVKVTSQDSELLRLNIQLRYASSTIIVTGMPYKIGLSIIPRKQKGLL